MPSSTGQASVTTPAARIAAGDLLAPSLVLLQNVGSVTFYWGYTSAVTTATGVSVPAGKTITVPVDAGESVYGVTAAGTTTVEYAVSRRLARVN